MGEQLFRVTEFSIRTEQPLWILFLAYTSLPLTIAFKLTYILFEPPRDKTNKLTCAPSEDSDQPWHPPSLISLRCALNG